jgi:hypothetical protein
MKESEHYLNELLIYLKLNSKEFAKSLGFNRVDRIYHILNGRNGISEDLAKIIVGRYKHINYDWLLTGKGEMLSSEKVQSKKLIPFYDDTTTIGGSNGQISSMNGVSSPTEYIDAGDWFRDATAAIRHYGESMVEYPSGCILALKEVKERHLIIWGKDYVVETNEYRITKRVQRGKSEDYIKAYSTNIETYPDGQLIHEPIDISWKDINRILIVLGYVVKKNGGTMVFSNQKQN